jgi:thiol:disulfide interchange protein DsbD
MREFLSAAILALALLAGAGPAGAAPRAEDLVKAELVAEPSAVKAGEPFAVGVKLTMAPHWHTYWRNPGDSGLATEIKWTLPDGMEAGPIQWPVPQRIPVSHLVNYGFEGETVLLTQITPPKDLSPGRPLTLKADVSYLVCEKECIPGEASLSILLPVAGGNEDGKPDPADKALFDAARSKLPTASPWTAKTEARGERLLFSVAAPGLKPDSIRSAYLLPFDETAVEHAAPQVLSAKDDGFTLDIKRSSLSQGDPAPLGGVLVLEEAIESGIVRHAIEIGAPAKPSSSGATALAASSPSGSTGGGTRSAVDVTLARIAQAALLAFLGGIILNLMPCVFPVLSIKVLSLVKHSGYTPALVRLNGFAYTAGVVGSFLLLAGILLAVRAGGAEVGWGFQLQSPAVVTALAFLLFAMGLSLSGIVEPGTSLAGFGQRLDTRTGLPGSFLTGVLATVVATPCTAPFMGAAIGFAVTAPAAVSLAIFAALGLGLALPFLLLTFWPGLARHLPRPGRWMETLKQFLAFPIYATVAWLLFVLSQEVGPTGLFAALIGLVAVGFAAWALRLGGLREGWSRRAWQGGALAAILILVGLGVVIDRDRAVAASASASGEPWQPFTQAKLDELRADGRPVFVNMTAAWCITCLVNERTALSTEAVQDAFRSRQVAYLKGDWTNRNPEITRLLEKHGRSGVPLYVFYPASGEPVVLPQILTQATVIDSLGAAAPSKRADVQSSTRKE